jgi:sugar-specific transcriptional regulator TrmB
MSSDPSDDPRSVAVEQLEQFGFSTYAARTFVALVSLDSGTAKDVSRVAEVPRTRVYDAVEELYERDLVDVRQSTPKEFWAISAETTARKFERELTRRTGLLVDALDALEPADSTAQQRGVWTVDGQHAVTDRVLELFREAEEEIVYMTVEDLLTDPIVAALGEAAQRGVSINLGGVSPAVQEEIREEVPGAQLFESLWVWSDTPAGRLLMVDGDRTLVSVLVNGTDLASPGERAETAIWGSGETNSLVVVLRAIFAWRLEDGPPE